MGTKQTRERSQAYMQRYFNEAFKRGRIIDYDKFIASMMLDLACSERYVKELVKMFAKLGRIKVYKKTNTIEVIQ